VIILDGVAGSPLRLSIARRRGYGRPMFHYSERHRRATAPSPTSIEGMQPMSVTRDLANAMPAEWFEVAARAR
jgi:hypothetical protein